MWQHHILVFHLLSDSDPPAILGVVWWKCGCIICLFVVLYFHYYVSLYFLLLSICISIPYFFQFLPVHLFSIFINTLVSYFDQYVYHYFLQEAEAKFTLALEYCPKLGQNYISRARARYMLEVSQFLVKFLFLLMSHNTMPLCTIHFCINWKCWLGCGVKENHSAKWFILISSLKKNWHIVVLQNYCTVISKQEMSLWNFIN